MKFFWGITSGPNIKDLGVVYPKETSSLFYFNNFCSIILKEIFLSKNSIFMYEYLHDFKCSNGTGYSLIFI